MRTSVTIPDIGPKSAPGNYLKSFADKRLDTARLIMMVSCNKGTKPTASPNPELNPTLRTLRSFLSEKQNAALASCAVTEALRYLRMQNSVYKWAGIAVLGVIPIPKGSPEAEMAGELLAETIAGNLERDHVEAASFVALAIKGSLPPAVRRQIDAALSASGRGK